MSMMVNSARFGSGAVPPPLDYDEFVFSGAYEEVTVPSGITSVRVWLLGGGGGNGNFNVGAYSGGGGFVEATFAVSTGDVLKFEVGGGGAGAARNANGGAGGWPDGGSGARGDAGSGGGGGSTRFYINGALMAVAAGGGGSGGFATAGSAGAGGGTTGQASSNGNGGTGGTPSAGGHDASDSGNANKTGRSIVSFPGAQRTGGWGAGIGDNTTVTTDDGGGGGGGYYGGGGGGGDAHPGGGGSSWTDASATDVFNRIGNRQATATTMVGRGSAGRGKNSGNNGAAVAGENGLAVLFWGGTTFGRDGGYTTTTAYAALANEKAVRSVTFGNSVTLRALHLDAPVGGSGSARAVIYSDSGGNPDALLFSSADVTVLGYSHFIEFDLAETVLPAGTYWIGYHLENACTLAGLAGSTRFNTDTFAGGASTPFGSHTTLSSTFKSVLFYE